MFILKDFLNRKRCQIVVSYTFAILGLILLILELTSLCVPESYNSYVLPYGIYIILFSVIGSFLISVYVNRPITQIKVKLLNRDIYISIVIGNFFDQHGDYIVGTNTTFDTNMEEKIISDKSIQGQFTKKYFGNRIDKLDEIIEKQLRSDENYSTDNTKIGKHKKYPIGKTITIRDDNVTGYFLALAHMNQDGGAYSSFENILFSLSKLWEYISSHGNMDSLVIPILGTGLSRIETRREIIIQEIIKSFIAACSEKKFSEHLIITILPSDYKKSEIDLNKLHDFLNCQCKYAEFKQNSIDRYGTGIER